MRNSCPPRLPVLVGFVVAVAIFGSACQQHGVAEVTPVAHREARHRIPVEPNRAIDLLFVIDNSSSMREEQESLAANFQTFIDVLESVPGGLPDVHIGVVSTDVGVGRVDLPREKNCGVVGNGGALRDGQSAGCAGFSGDFLSDVADGRGGRVRNYEGTLRDQFSCLASLGTEGCGIEQPLESMRQALDAAAKIQAGGFLRADAFLAVIILSDEDDCSVADPRSFFDPRRMDLGPTGRTIEARCSRWSLLCDGAPFDHLQARTYDQCEAWSESPHMTKVEDYAKFLRKLKLAKQDSIIVAAIAGSSGRVFTKNVDNAIEVDAACHTEYGKADPAVRLQSFLEQFPTTSKSVSICEHDLSGALEAIGQTIVSVVGDPCLSGGVDLTDMDDELPGLQLACEVEDVSGDGLSSQFIPPCAMVDDATPVKQSEDCWWTRYNEDVCSPGVPELVVERQSPAPSGTITDVRCPGI
jgi:hypothetical protein